MSPGNGEHPPRDPRQLDGLDTYPVAQVEAFVERIDELEAENKALRDRVAELESEAKQAREDEAWAEDNGVVIDAEPVEKGWCAMLVREDGPLIEVPSAKGPTIHAAIRALRAKVEGGKR